METQEETFTPALTLAATAPTVHQLGKVICVAIV
jgi:hypothetical protein